jgi:uncharacterized YccA/Bax inhibitor family protein
MASFTMVRAVDQITHPDQLDSHSGGFGDAPLAQREPAFSARNTYDKLFLLVVITAFTGAIGYRVGTTVAVVPSLLITLGCAIACMFRPQWARILAPIYAVFKGFFLGALSAAYATLGGGIVPTAILLTAGFFVGAMVLYRTGIVKVTPKFMAITAMATMGLFVVYMASLFGLNVPGVDGVGGRGLIFGVIGVGIGIMNLFTDFEYIQQAETRGGKRSSEWYGAFALLLSLVMIYVHVLRVLASSQRRR